MDNYITNGIHHEDIIECYLNNNLQMNLVYEKFTMLTSSQLWDIVQNYITEMDEVLPVKRLYPTCR